MKTITHILTVLFLAVCATLSLQSCKNEIPQPENSLKLHTVIVYMGAENDLNNFSQSDISEMTLAHKDIPQDCQVVIFKDDTGLPSISLLNNKGLTTWKEYKDEINSADASTMKKVLQGIISDFPSKKYSLVLWSHGSGWSNRTRSIIIDNGNNSYSNYGSWLHISDLAKILSSLPRMEYIFFDACYMQTVEVASDLYPYTDYIIASPTEIPGEGAPYDKIMSALCKANPQEIINGYASAYQGLNGVLLSAVYCKTFPDFCQETSKYIPKYLIRENMPGVAGIQIYAPAYGTASDKQDGMPVPYDMRSAMHKILSTEEFNEWDTHWERTILYPKSAKEWATIYKGVLHCTMQDPEHYGGISMNIPQEGYTAKGWNDQFKTTTWYLSTGWSGTGW